MKKEIIMFLFLIISISFLFSMNDKINGLTDELNNKLSGVWVPDKKYSNFVKKFPWGYSKFNSRWATVLNLSSNTNAFYYDSPSNIGINFPIISINELSNNKYKIILDLENTEIENDKKNYVLIKWLSNNKIKIDEAPIFFQDGEFYRIGGPNIPFNDYYTPSVNKLRLREGSNLTSKKIRLLKKGEKLVILNKYGKEDVIDGIKGTWVLIESVENNDRGWCFDAYLEAYNGK